MIQKSTILDVADNSGAKRVKCIGFIKCAWVDGAAIADQITVSIQEALPNSKVEPGQVKSAIIVRTKMPIKRTDGSVLNFKRNAVVLINNQGEPIGTRVFGPIAREVRGRSIRIASLAEEVV